MTNRRTSLLTLIAALLITLFFSATTTSAQNVPWWGGSSSSSGRDRDDRNYGYNRRGLRDAIRRVDDRSDNFRDSVDRALDRSRYDDTRREDRINDVARDFENAARNLKNRFNERDLYRSENEARRLIQLGSQIDRVIGRNRLDARTVSEWNRISSDLRIIADAYNLRTRDRDYGNGRGRNRRDDGYNGDRRRPF